MLPAEPSLVGWYGGYTLAAEPSPAFQFYPKDFLTDVRVATMTLDELGAYIKLLCVCWLDQSIPGDTRRLAILVGVDAGVFAEMWPQLESCFVRDDDGRLRHPRLDKERQKQAKFSAAQAERGSRGGRAKARNASQEVAGDKPEPSRDVANASPTLQPEASRDVAGSQPEASRNLALQSPDSSLTPNPLTGAVEEVPKVPERYVVEPALADRCEAFMAAWPEVYARARSGAYPRRKDALDWPKLFELLTAYPDVDRLLLMADVFLRRTDIGPKNVPGTLGQFAHMAPDCDRLLREHGK